MNMFTLSLLNGIIFALNCYVISFIILEKKETNIKRIITALIPFLLVYYAILCLLDSIYSIFFTGICAFLFIKMIFKENIYMSLFLSLVTHVIKIIFKIIILWFLNDPQFKLINTYKTINMNVFYINTTAIVLSIIFVLIFRKVLRKFIKYISSLNSRKTILLIAVYVNFFIIYFYQPPYDEFTLKAVVDMLIILGVTGVGIFNISSEMKTEDLTRHYQEIFEYSKSNEELLYKYKMQVHENKNRLLMIRGMLGSSKNDIKKYIDELLKEMEENKSQCNYWLTELKYIPIPGVRNFINYKLRKLKDLGAEIEVFVSSEMGSIDASTLCNKEYNQLTTILGVILDNMIESIKVTEEKLISINMYIEEDIIHAEFVNSFSGKIDLQRLNEVGYTTKGEQHGVGLPLVAQITKINDRFTCEPNIIDNFFIQHFSIKLYNKKNKKNNTSSHN